MTTKQTSPRAPRDLKTSGARLWRSVVDRYELEEHESALLHQAARTVDLLDALQAALDADGPLVDGRAHPAAVESRQQRIALARLLAALRLPDEDQHDRRPQRRVGARGVYGVVA